MEMDATTAFALCVAINRAVPTAVVSAMEVERLKTALQVSAQEHEAFVAAEREREERRNEQIEQALEGLDQGVCTLRVLARVLYIVATSSLPITPPAPCQ